MKDNPPVCQGTFMPNMQSCPWPRLYSSTETRASTTSRRKQHHRCGCICTSRTLHQVKGNVNDQICPWLVRISSLDWEKNRWKGWMELWDLSILAEEYEEDVLKSFIISVNYDCHIWLRIYIHIYSMYIYFMYMYICIYVFISFMHVHTIP